MGNDSATREAVNVKALSEIALATRSFCRGGAWGWASLAATVSPPRQGPHVPVGLPRAPLDRVIVLGPAEDERLLAKSSPSCTCDIALAPGTMLMDWREFRGEPGT